MGVKIFRAASRKGRDIRPAPPYLRGMTRSTQERTDPQGVIESLGEEVAAVERELRAELAERTVPPTPRELQDAVQGDRSPQVMSIAFWRLVKRDVFCLTRNGLVIPGAAA